MYEKALVYVVLEVMLERFRAMLGNRLRVHFMDGRVRVWRLIHPKTSPDGAVAKSWANWLVGTGFASRYRLQA